MRVSTTNNLRYLKLKPNFTNSTVTLTDGFGGAAGTFINIPIGTTTNACNGAGNACIAQPGTTTLLDTLGTRLMYRLAYRNRGGVESMMVTHSVDPDGAGARGAALRWYEIRNPLANPADPVVANRPTLFQNGTYDPGATGDRWMGSIAMDQFGNMLMGYTIANAGAGVFPSMAVAGRELNDAVGTLQAEATAQVGSGSQTGGLTRWGDYSTIQVDPSDDRTFWYIGQYLSANGSFNWRSRVVSYSFPVPAATLSISDVSLSEGNAGTANAQFTITRSHTTSAVSVRVDTANGTATTADSDYVGITNQTVNFTAGGSATATVNVTINGDTKLEADETFTINLSNPSNATIADGVGAGTINNDDSASIAINDVTLAEGNSGTTNFEFTVSLTGSVQGGFTVPFSTANGTATQPGDYASNSGNLSFTGAVNETRTITVAVVGDAVLEPDETYAVNLGTPSNAAVTVSDGAGQGTINNDDAASVAINDVTLSEGNSGTTNFVFTVSLTGSVQGGFTVPFSTANGTATQPGDYASNSGNLSFTGAVNETRTITVAVVGDTMLEPDETLAVNLGTPSNAAVTVSDGAGLGTINNDDAASIAINSVTQAEGNSGTSNFVFTVSLTGSVQGGFSVPFSTANGTATQPADYASNSGTLNFTGGAAETRTITVAVVGDSVPEADENFFVNLGSATAGVTVSQAQGTGLIVNDDLFADISVSNSDGVSWVAPLDTTTYTVVVTNTSTIIDVAGVSIVQTLPALLINVGWTCTGAGGASCPASGSGAINQSLAMPKNSSLTFLVAATVAAPGGTPPPSIATSVTASVQAPASDPDSANNTAIDTNTLITDIIFRDGFQ